MNRLLTNAPCCPKYFADVHLAPEWTIRFRIAPVVPVPWKYLKKTQHGI